MRIYFIIVLFLSIVHPSFAQEKNEFSNQEISVDFGSYRTRYAYPITDLFYSSKIIEKYHLKFSARLRSYGTLYFYSTSAYDLTPLVEYYFTKKLKPFYFSVGVGLDTRIRLVHDLRSDATNSVEPIISFAFHGNYKKISFQLPLWTRFYSNGISYTILPEVNYRLGKNTSIFLRDELSSLNIYNPSSQEWVNDAFIGVKLKL